MDLQGAGQKSSFRFVCESSLILFCADFSVCHAVYFFVSCNGFHASVSGFGPGSRAGRARVRIRERLRLLPANTSGRGNAFV